MKNEKQKIRIIVFGFSGSGKSTIAKMLARELKLRVIHPSSILRDLALKKTPEITKSKSGRGFWESAAGIKLFKDRLKAKTPADFECDKILLKELRKGAVVIDSWSLAWLTKHAFKIYLQSSRETRVKRVARRSRINQTKARSVIIMKDGETRELYREHKGFDIKRDTHVFDLIINTDKLNLKNVFSEILSTLNLRGIRK
ncbi:MAG: cytidylate kinase family protein [Candidatus Falkowbacteria bacterium]|nr:cytidylate kinase family protein [Candidatus Falkowbacteria bacterium]